MNTRSDSPLLMIPGPIEVSPGVREAASGPPPSHLAPHVIEAFGSSIEMMRRVWLADASSQPFIVAGGGTVAMDMAVSNLIARGDRVVVVNTGYFSDRITEMLRRQGANVVECVAEVGDAPSADQVREAVDGGEQGPAKAMFATHVDTSTGVRIDVAPLARLCRERDVLSIFDGVCATAAERFEMADWGADVYLTASQKAIGLPAGLALMVASRRAVEKRSSLASAPPMYLDWEQWLPIMQAYEERRPSYFSTPATNLILALATGLNEILASGMEARFALHQQAAQTMQAAWKSMELKQVPVKESLTSNALSALEFPEGIDASLVGRILGHGVIVAGGLHPAIRTRYFRVGHMGYAAERPEMLQRTVEAIAMSLQDARV